MNNKAKVYLIGAGIGDEKYITVKGKEILEKADVIVYDRLLNKNLIGKNYKLKEYINVGKQSSNHTMPQDEINNILVKKALEGKIVARLKGGDPYVFGRGAEEGLFLYENNIDFEVVPGITAGIAGLCFAGIPATHRDLSSSLHFITGHLKTEKEPDYEALVRLNGTIVFYMGLSNLENITTNMMKYNKNPDTTCAVISNAGYPNQKVITSNIKDICANVKNQEIKSPSLIVIGEVVELRDKLCFYESKILFGKNIVVTRSSQNISRLSEALREMGANVIEIPTIKIIPTNSDSLSKSLENINNYSHIIFTSRNAVQIFMDHLMEYEDVRKLFGIKIYTIGDKTKEEIKKYNIKPDFMPSEFVSEILLDEIKDKIKNTDNILIPRAKKARPFLCEELSKICNVDEIQIYDTMPEDINDEQKSILKSNKIDYITFTSSSTVEYFLLGINQDILNNIKSSKIISIGPITSKTITESGLKVYSEAKIHNIENLIKNITDDNIKGENLK